MIVIEWLRTAGAAERHEFVESEVTLGSSPRNNLVLEGRGLLKKHCSVRARADGSFELISMSGRDAVLVNGERLFRGEIRTGDRLRIGSVNLLFLGDGRARPTPPHLTDAPSPADETRSMAELLAARTAAPGPVDPESEADVIVEPAPVILDSAVVVVDGLEFVGPSIDGVRRRGRRPVQLAEVPTTTPHGALQRRLLVIFGSATSFLEKLESSLDLLEGHFESVSFVVADRRLGSTPTVLYQTAGSRSMVFSRKALAELELNPRVLATREGERINVYYPLVDATQQVLGLFVARGALVAADRELLEGVAFQLGQHLARVPRDRVHGQVVEELSAIFDPDSGGLSDQVDDLKEITCEIERIVIDRVMRREKGNQSRAAGHLNISRGSLIAKLKAYDIPDYRRNRRA